MRFPGDSVVKNQPSKQEIWVCSLGQEDPLEKGMAIHSSILAWRIPWTEKPGRLQFVGLQRVGHNLVTNTHVFDTMLSVGEKRMKNVESHNQLDSYLSDKSIQI